MQDMDDEDEDDDEHNAVDYENETIQNKLKIEAEASKLGRMQREMYFKQCLSRLFHSLLADYEHTDFDRVFENVSKTISVGPIILD
mmetsp:Transcript_47739/g.76526  ORF Transcript_47739/g.76526 Transcript_47739/m.76526 type:complete len:86 (-) Transcript_47739:22-279(-)